LEDDFAALPEVFSQGWDSFDEEIETVRVVPKVKKQKKKKRKSRQFGFDSTPSPERQKIEFDSTPSPQRKTFDSTPSPPPLSKFLYAASPSPPPPKQIPREYCLTQTGGDTPIREEPDYCCESDTSCKKELKIPVKVEEKPQSLQYLRPRPTKKRLYSLICV
jgi:hypothetical protein